MRRIRHFFAALKVSPAGWVLVVVVPVSLLLAYLGPAAVQTPAFVVAAFALAAVLTEALGAAGRGRGLSSSRERREFAERAAKARPVSNEAPVEAGEDAWRRERERREGRERVDTGLE
jgi:membrane protein implicated in regulation of membrane protease activity